MTIDVSGVAVSLPLLALCGLVVGVVAGMFGIGGGFLLTPLLPIVFRVPSAIAIGTSLCQQIGIAMVAFLKHRGYRHGEPRMDFIMLGGSLLGVDAGTRILALLAASGARRMTLVLDGGYALLLLFAAVLTLRGAFHTQAVPEPIPAQALLSRIRLPPYISLPAVGIPRASAPIIAWLGFLLGALSGLLGVGGGVALLPVLVYGFGFPIRHAAGTGILVLLATVTFGTLEHALAGHVDLRMALAILAGSSLGAQLGARLTARLSSRALRIWFAVLLLITLTTVAVHLVRQY
jgi:uncharacterized protein